MVPHESYGVESKLGSAFGAQVDKQRAPRNRTLTLADHERATFVPRLVTLDGPVALRAIENRTICSDLFRVADYLPDSFVDLLFVDPPYNIDKSFNGTPFREVSVVEYGQWVESWLIKVIRCLKPTASVYICSDWRSSAAIQLAAEKHLTLRNRITWEREKGRGARRNWKNCSEDIWFFTRSNAYHFDVEAVKLKRRVIAPYTENGKPKDWERTPGGNFRDTHPSNLWTDLTVPFWSMLENTDHPTQKPEKLLAKVILASSRPGGLVLDPFLGSGTTSVVAKKLGRRFVGIEMDETYCCLAEKRLELADTEKAIQGYADGVFWERNTHQFQPADAVPSVLNANRSLFD